MMEQPRELLDYATAKSFAESVARHESLSLTENENYSVADAHAEQHPWGWIFTPLLTRSEIPTNDPVTWQISVDRFNGKVLIVGRPEIGRDIKQKVQLALHSVGDDTAAVYRLLHQLMGWTALEIEKKLTDLPVVLRVGPMLSLRSMHEAFIERGASTSLTLLKE